jgi:hypothetical protein
MSERTEVRGERYKLSLLSKHITIYYYLLLFNVINVLPHS